MAEIIKMPKLSDTMEEGVVAKWHKKIGDRVEEGELLAEIETDKATMEFESFQEGVVLHHGVSEGKAAKVDSILAVVGDKGEDISSLLAGGNSKKKEQIIDNEEVKDTPMVDTSNINAKIIKMPKLSDTMTEGTVASWQKEVGDAVESGEILAEIETDKATMEFESFEDGILLYKGVASGESAVVDAILAVVGEKGADYKTLINSFSVGGNEPAKEVIQPVEEVKEIKKEAVKAVISSNGRLKISPLALRIAKEKSIKPETIVGTGDGGRIIKRDVESFKSSNPVIASHRQESFEEIAVTQMRKTIAKRLGESKYNAPHFYLTIDLDMDAAIAARKAINNLPDTKVSFNDLVIKAVSSALKKHPSVNASWQEDKIIENHHVHIGVAVAVDEGLLVPVVRHADTKQLSEITQEVRAFAQKAKEKKLQPQDWEGSTFSISNLGMFGIEEFTAIINPPNACILAVGAIRETPVVRNGEIVVGNKMKVTLSCDHRVVDGAVGSKFLQTFKTFIENPVTILG